MNRLNGLAAGLGRIMDRIAGLCLVAIMILVVTNVLFRALFKRPVLGTYDYVTLSTAVMISLALAYCAVQNGHIAVGFVVDRLPKRRQAAVDTAVNLAAVAFWGLCSWQMAAYAGSMASRGVVAATSQIPLYPFIYLVAFGLAALCLVLLVRAVESAMRAAGGK